MNDGNPPSSWYDPPECPYEINAGRAAAPGEKCYVCDEPAELEIEIRDTRVRYGGSWIAFCEAHEDEAFEKFINRTKEDDYDDDHD